MSDEKLRQGKQAAFNVAIWGIVLSAALALCVGLLFAESDDAFLRRAHWLIAGVGIVATFTIVIHILTQDFAAHTYRENLKAESESERAQADIAKANAIAAYYAAKERAQYTPLPGRVAPRLPEAPERAIYSNGERVGDAFDEPDEDLPMSDTNDAPNAALVQTGRNQWRFIERAEPANDSAGVSARGQMVITESADAYNLRMRRLAGEIYELCRDVNPATQDLILERIPRTRGGLLRSNDDITKALNLLAERGLIEPSKGQGIVRRWLINGKPAPLTPKRTRIESNVRVEQ